MEAYCPYCMHPAPPEGPCPGCGKRPNAYQPSSHHFPPGRLLHGRYAVGRALGEGGFGITYLGMDTNLERRVAIKEYFPTTFVKRETSVTLNVTCYTQANQNLYEKGRDQFLQEARTMARLDKIPEIVQVLDYFPENNTAYIVMEFLEGSTLKELTAQQGRIPAKGLLEMLEPVLRGMEAMHAAGIIHRDISPDNLMVLKSGKVKLMDFGCARDIEGGHTMTTMLKHGFAPKEQYSGHGQGPWTDVYALCATMYYCLTGRVPPSAMERDDSEEDPLVPPTRLGAMLSPGQETALLKGLAVRAKNRWQSAANLYAALYGQTMEGYPWVPPEEDTGRTEETETAGGTENGAPIGETEFVREDETAAEDGRQERGGTEYIREEQADDSGPEPEPEPRKTRGSPTAWWKGLSRQIKIGAGAAACLVVILGVALAVGGNWSDDSALHTGNGTQQADGRITNTPEPTDSPEPTPDQETEGPTKLTGIEGAESEGTEETTDPTPASPSPSPSESPAPASPSPSPSESPAPASPSPSPSGNPTPASPSPSPSGSPAPASPSPSPSVSAAEPEIGDTFTYGNFSCEYSYHGGVDGLALVVTYTGSESSVTVPAEINGYPVKWLSSFGSNSSLESITIQTSGQGVYYIYGFSGCSNLKRATIGGNARINAGAFSGCASLTSVSLGTNCEVEEAAFQNATALSSVTLGEGCTIGEDAFAGCTSLTSITLPASCVYDWEAFPDGCTVTGGTQDVL